MTLDPLSEAQAAREHYSVDLLADEDGWWLATCVCGWSDGPYPEAEDACDALMDHAYEAGRFDGWKETR